MGFREYEGLIKFLLVDEHYMLLNNFKIWLASEGVRQKECSFYLLYVPTGVQSQ